MPVDPGWGYPLRHPVRVDHRAPAPAGELMMVIPTQEGHVVQVREATIDPGNDVMAFAELRSPIASRVGVPGVEDETHFRPARDQESGAELREDRDTIPGDVATQLALLKARGAGSGRVVPARAEIHGDPPDRHNPADFRRPGPPDPRPRARPPRRSGPGSRRHRSGRRCRHPGRRPRSGAPCAGIRRCRGSGRDPAWSLPG